MRDGPRGGGACASSRIEATRHPPVKGQRASPGPAGVGKRPGWAAPRRLVDEWTALVLPTLRSAPPAPHARLRRDHPGSHGPRSDAAGRVPTAPGSSGRRPAARPGRSLRPRPSTRTSTEPTSVSGSRRRPAHRTSRRSAASTSDSSSTKRMPTWPWPACARPAGASSCPRGRGEHHLGRSMSKVPRTRVSMTTAATALLPPAQPGPSRARCQRPSRRPGWCRVARGDRLGDAPGRSDAGALLRLSFGR